MERDDAVISEKLKPINISKIRLRWREGARQGDEWVVVRLEFRDASGTLVTPKKGLSTGSHQDFRAHDNVVIKKKDGYAYNYYAYEWRGQPLNGQIYIGAIFHRAVDIRHVCITHEKDPCSRTGDLKTITVEFWGGHNWHEYPSNYLDYRVKYRISHYRGNNVPILFVTELCSFTEKKIRELPESIAVIALAEFGKSAPVTDSDVTLMCHRDEIEASHLWRVSCEESKHWGWDVKSLVFYGLEDQVLVPVRAFSSGHYDPQQSANQAIFHLGNIWAGQKDEDEKFYLGCEFTDDVIVSHIEIVQPYGQNWRNDLYVESWDFTMKSWRVIGRYRFYDHFIKRGPISLPVIKRFEMSFIRSVYSAVPFAKSSICDENSTSLK